MTSTKNNLGEVWILEEGYFYTDRGLVVCAAKSKAAMIRWIKANYPTHKRNRRDCDSREIYFECNEEQTWLRCEQMDRCPLVV